MDHRNFVWSRILGVDFLSDLVHSHECIEFMLDIYFFIVGRVELEEVDFLRDRYRCRILHRVERRAYRKSIWLLSIWGGTWLEVVGYTCCHRSQLGHHDLEQFEFASLGMGLQQQMVIGIGRRNVDDIN